MVVLPAEFLDVRLAAFHLRVDLDRSQAQLLVLVEHAPRRALVQLPVGLDAHIFLAGAQNGGLTGRLANSPHSAILSLTQHKAHAKVTPSAGSTTLYEKTKDNFRQLVAIVLCNNFI